MLRTPASRVHSRFWPWPTSLGCHRTPVGTKRYAAILFYVKTMGEMFTKRLMKVVGDTNIQVYGNAAVVEFNLDFVASLRANGQTIHTTGRESQVYINTPEKGWRLVHVHYSGPPVGGPE